MSNVFYEVSVYLYFRNGIVDTAFLQMHITITRSFVLHIDCTIIIVYIILCVVVIVMCLSTHICSFCFITSIFQMMPMHCSVIVVKGTNQRLVCCCIKGSILKTSLSLVLFVGKDTQTNGTSTNIYIAILEHRWLHVKYVDSKQCHTVDTGATWRDTKEGYQRKMEISMEHRMNEPFRTCHFVQYYIDRIL